MTEEPAGQNRRADAQRNRAAILDAASACLAANARASMTEIAQAAGVGRVTLYGHFSSRGELLDAAAAQTMRRVEEELAPLKLDGDPSEALDLLVRSSWRIVDNFHGLLAVADDDLGSDRIREHHDATLLRVRALIERGQEAGIFRTDLTSQWLTGCFFSLLHGAAAEIRAGRLTESDAAKALPATIKSLTARTPA
ncbi:TetR/AcrR family transcriptional regulator [Arthrobacter wenxiniae]|uniref:TetR/AcrR family transcriptional regulator n=1 Tax=Arthrobacter wenxiniae TaxID=2713570 RepID=A0A7Y7IK16_9MICC|nr:TetR/AcrR family transcriptional regulator [Arthrobacter wenxiniae]NVM96570.1 TetR/AcrR family transcriptional regulator [Arthrobacter wenxiniae]